MTHRIDWDGAVRHGDTVQALIDPAPEDTWVDALGVALSSREDECRQQVYDEVHIMGDSLVITESPAYAERPTREFFDMVVRLADRSTIA
ncbi:MAG TPA: hypothetical protein VMI13_06505 [Solirubrobacteraceae bacterium]|nr:hypothetical protein [Solirubrobacteraceae bacterium]